MKAARTVFIKELRETLRDRRSLLVAFLMPLLLMPLVLLVAAATAHYRERSDREETLTVGLINTAAMPGLPEALGAATNLQPRSFALREDAEAAMQDQSVRAALLVPSDSAGAFQENRAAAVEILYDGANDKSRLAHERLKRVLDEVTKKEQLRRLETRGLDRSLLEPMDVRSTNLAPPHRKGGFLLGTLLPYFVVLWTVVGGMNAAFDMCAGEKERGTMETLLVSSASRRQIIAGKLGAVWVMSVAAALFSLIGMVLAVSGGFRSMVQLGGEQMDVSYGSVALALVTVIPLALMMSALLLMISTFARSQKEAQAYSVPITTVVTVAAMLSIVLGQENSIALGAVPVLNTALAMKQVLGGMVDIPFLAVSLASSVVYALITLKLAGAMFEREAVLFRT